MSLSSWWQFLPSGPVLLEGRPGNTEGRVRFVTTEHPVPGGSFSQSYQRIFGSMTYCAPVPRNAPDARPADPYIAGRAIGDRQIYITEGYLPTFNTSQYNLPTFIIDSTLPPGPAADGGGNYTRGRLYHRWERNYYVPRGGTFSYWQETLDVPIPIGFRGASGTDASASVIDIGTGKIVDYWVVATADGTRTYLDTSSQNGNSELAASYSPIPAGETCYTTFGEAYNYRTPSTPGAFNRGNVVASGMIGSGFQIGIHEALMASGLKINPDGSISDAPPIVDAIQHVIGLEFALWFGQGQGQFSWPANFTDANNAVADELLYGQRLYFDPNVVKVSDYPDPFTRALVWTGTNYGFIPTDVSGNFAIRGEFWFRPDPSHEHPWTRIFNKSSGGDRAAILRRLPWYQLRSLPKDYGKPGTPTAGLLSPLGIPA